MPSNNLGTIYQQMLTDGNTLVHASWQQANSPRRVFVTLFLTSLSPPTNNPKACSATASLLNVHWQKRALAPLSTPKCECACLYKSIRNSSQFLTHVIDKLVVSASPPAFRHVTATCDLCISSSELCFATRILHKQWLALANPAQNRTTRKSLR